MEFADSIGSFDQIVVGFTGPIRSNTTGAVSAMCEKLSVGAIQFRLVSPRADALAALHVLKECSQDGTLRTQSFIPHRAPT